jgi:hypothetical protein
MSFNEHPDAKAAEVAASLKEWPLKISMLILALNKTVFNHLDSVDDVTLQ